MKFKKLAMIIHLDKNPLNYNKKNPNTDGAEFKQLSVVYNVLNDKKALSNNKMVRKIWKRKIYIIDDFHFQVLREGIPEYCMPAMYDR